MPERINLLGGSYVARSVIANAQRSINYFPEINRKDGPCPITLYQRPGLRAVAQGPLAAPVRCLYPASTGQAFCVIGQDIFQLAANFQLTKLGSLQTLLATPVSMSDNGTTLVIADGSQLGYSYKLDGSGNLSQIIDPSGTFVGANRWDYIDTFFVWNQIGTRNFGSTKSNVLTFDPLYVAGKTTYPDKLVSLIVNRHQLLLLGQFKSELWYNSGGALFPFAQNPGVYIEWGCQAPYSVASIDVMVFWLAQSLQGRGMVMMQQGYQTQRVSNHALEYAIRKMPRVDDAIGYTYQQDGHMFYVLTFPSANQTWVFDSSIGDPSLAWHQRAWTDQDGSLNRDRTNCHANLFGLNLVGDWQNGTIYALDPDVYVDNVGGAPGPISFIRGFQHVTHGWDDKAQSIVPASGKEIMIQQFMLDLECGEAPADAQGNPAQVKLRYSRDRGKTFSTDLMQSAGAPGEFEARPNWPGLGMGNNQVFEVEHSIAGPAALNGAFVTASVVGQ